MAKYVCPKALACSRTGTPAFRNCLHKKPHERNRGCWTGSCSCVPELEHFKCSCTPVQFLKESNKKKIEVMNMVIAL